MRTAIFNSESFPNAHNISVCNSHNVIQITTCTDLVKHFCCLIWTGQNLKKINQTRKGQNSPFFYISNTLVWAFCASFLFLPQSDSTCDLLLNRHTATWNLLACTVVGVRSFHLSACPPTHHQWEPIKVHLKYCICIFLAAVLKQSRKYQQYCAIVTDLDVANDPRYLHGCVEL